MANSSQSLKRVRQAERRRQANQGARAHFRTMVKRARAAIADPEKGREAFVNMQSVADRAARCGIIHPRTVARLKSRINSALRAAAKQRQVAEQTAAE